MLAFWTGRWEFWQGGTAPFIRLVARLVAASILPRPGAALHDFTCDTGTFGTPFFRRSRR